MHIQTIILPLILALTASATIPADAVEALNHHTPDAPYPTTHPAELSARRIKAPGVYVCNKPGWAGNCWFAHTNRGQCFKWDEIKSIGPDNGLFCDLFDGEECGGKPVLKFITWPGVDDTKKNGAKSWRCGV